MLLQNYTFVIAVVNDSLFEVEQLHDGTLIGKSGLNYLVLECLAMLLGFNYRLVIPKDKEYGLLSPNGTWNGIIRMLMQDEADFGAVNLYVTPERQKVVNFSVICNHDKVVHITKADSSKCGSNGRFMTGPFQAELWLFMFTSALLLMVGQLVASCFPKLNNLALVCSPWKILSLTVGLGNSRNSTIFNVSGIIAISMIIYLGCTMKLYGSTLASAVNVKKCDNPLDNLDEFGRAVRSKRLTIGILEHQGIVHACLKNSIIPELIEFGRYLDDRGVDREQPFLEAWNSIMNSNLAILSEIQFFVMFMDNHKISLNTVHFAKEPILKINLAMPYGRSFKFKKIINQAISRIQTFGLYDKFVFNEMFFLERDLAVAEEERQNQTQNIGMIDLEYVFVLFVVVLITNIFLVVVENFSASFTVNVIRELS